MLKLKHSFFFNCSLHPNGFKNALIGSKVRAIKSGGSQKVGCCKEVLSKCVQFQKQSGGEEPETPVPQSGGFSQLLARVLTASYPSVHKLELVFFFFTESTPRPIQSIICNVRFITMKHYFWPAHLGHRYYIHNGCGKCLRTSDIVCYLSTNKLNTYIFYKRFIRIKHCFLASLNRRSFQLTVLLNTVYFNVCLRLSESQYLVCLFIIIFMLGQSCTKSSNKIVRRS